MASVSRILLPTAFSVLSRKAAEYVQLLLPRLDARLHVVHIVPHTAVLVDPGMPPMTPPIAAAPLDELVTDARRRLDSFVRELLPEFADRTTTAVTVGGVTDELLRYVHRHDIDLVIMGTHADGMLKRIVWGSVGKGVLEGAACPVLLVPVRGAPRV